MNTRTGCWATSTFLIVLVGCSSPSAPSITQAEDAGEVVDGGVDSSDTPSADTGVDSARDEDVGVDSAVQKKGGIGDPCTAHDQCLSGSCALTTGVRSWCTKQCADISECAGGEPLGKNAQGQINYCLPIGNGLSYCFPGCTADADCKIFPNSTCGSFIYKGSNGSACAAN